MKSRHSTCGLCEYICKNTVRDHIIDNLHMFFFEYNSENFIVTDILFENVKSGKILR